MEGWRLQQEVVLNRRTCPAINQYRKGITNHLKNIHLADEGRGYGKRYKAVVNTTQHRGTGKSPSITKVGDSPQLRKREKKESDHCS